MPKKLHKSSSPLLNACIESIAIVDLVEEKFWIFVEEQFPIESLLSLFFSVSDYSGRNQPEKSTAIIGCERRQLWRLQTKAPKNKKPGSPKRCSPFTMVINFRLLRMAFSIVISCFSIESQSFNSCETTILSNPWRQILPSSSSFSTEQLASVAK